MSSTFILYIAQSVGHVDIQEKRYLDYMLQIARDNA